MSKIEANTIDSVSGTSTLTLGSSNASTIALGSGDVQSNFLQPSFNVRMNTLQNISNETITLVAFDTEIYDTDNAFDNSASNYKFTVPSGKAGKYYFFASTNLDAVSSANLQNCQMYFYKNGSVQHKISTNFNSNDIKAYQATLSTTLDLSVGDYVQVYARISDSSGSPRIDGSDTAQSQFFGFRIGT